MQYMVIFGFDRVFHIRTDRLVARLDPNGL